MYEKWFGGSYVKYIIFDLFKMGIFLTNIVSLQKICFCKPFIGDEITLDSMLMRQSTEGVEASNTQPLKSKNIIDTSIVNKTKDSKRPKPSKHPAKKLEKVKGKSKQKKKLKLMSSSDELVVAKPNTQKNNDIW